MDAKTRYLVLAAGIAAAAAGALILLALLEDRAGVPAGPAPAPAGAAREAETGRGPRAPGGAGGDAPVPPPRADGPRGEVEGRVLDPEGQPAPGVAVSARGGAPGAPWMLRARSGRGGDFRFRIPAGTARLQARSGRHLDSPEVEIEVEPGGRARAELRLAARARVSVRIAGPDGALLSDATLRLIHSRTGEVFVGETGPGGSAEFPALPKGDYRVEASAPGFVMGPSSPRVVSVKGPGDSPSVRLHVSSRIGGRVRDERGRPLSGAEVRAFLRSGPAGRVVSAADGSYLLEVLPGRLSVLAIHTDKAPAFAGELTAPEGGWTSLDVEMNPGSALRGTVRGPGGAPVPGARIRAQWLSSVRGFAHTYPEVEAASDGAFRLERLAPGPHAVAVRADGFAPAVQHAQAGAAGGEATLDFTLGGGFALQGRVKDSRGDALPGARVEVQGGGGAAVAGPDGRFRIEGLPRGAVSLSISAEGRVPVLVSSAMAPGSVPDVVLRAMGSLRGRVEFDGVGQEGVAVVASSGGDLRFQAFTEPGGSFAFPELPPGTYRLEARVEGFLGAAGPLQVPEGGSGPEAVVALEAVDGE